MDWNALFLTVKLSLTSTTVLFAVALPVAVLLSRGHFFGRSLIESIIMLPGALPQVVLGFYLLLLFSPTSPVGGLIKSIFNRELAFTFEGMVVACCIFGFPLMTMHLKTGLEQVDRRLVETSWLLGVSRWRTFFKVTLPLCRSSIAAAVATTFSHLTGAFGLVLMVGGNIPGETRVASVAIYESVETLQYKNAHLLALCLIGVSFGVLLLVHRLNHGKRRPWMFH